MNALFLSGESINNKVWIEEVERSLHDLFGETKILYYDHWESGEPTINLDNELNKLPNLVKGFDKYFLFAKSIGSVLALKAIYEKIILPEKCFFAGPAFLVGEKSVPNFKEYIQDFSIPSVVLCKSFDPVAPAKETSDLLSHYNVQKNKFIEIPGDNHKYEDIVGVKSLVVEFIK